MSTSTIRVFKFHKNDFLGTWDYLIAKCDFIIIFMNFEMIIKKGYPELIFKTDSILWWYEA